MPTTARLASGATVLAAALVMLWPAPAARADEGLGLQARAAQPSFRIDEPIRLTLAVTNGTGVECGLARDPEGTVQVVAVRKDGQELSPLLGRSFYVDGINNAIVAGMTRAAQQSTVDVAFASVRVHDGAEPGSAVLRSVAATPEGGGLDALWPVGTPGRYEVTLAYAVPSVDGGDIAPCGGATTSQTVTFIVGEEKPQSVLWVLPAAAAIIVLVLVLVVVLVRKRRKAGAAVALFLAVAVISVPRPARAADYEIDPNAGIPVPGVDFKAAVEGCLAGFAAPGGDPAGILPRLKDPKSPKVRIIPTTGGSNAFETPASKDGKGSSSIAWNPTSTEAYEGDVARDPCSALYHELAHADDISKDAVPQGDCGDTGIKTAEVKATFTENRYRRAKGLPPRTKYQGKPLPKSLDECKKPKKKQPPQKGPVKLCEGAGKNQCGSTNGDPHLVTFDRAYYDFQAVGEFVVVRSTSGEPLEVQARQAPLGSSRTVSVNTAVGFRVGTQKIELVIVNGTTQVRMDGSAAGVLRRRESDINVAGGYDIIWPDGSEAAVDQIGTYGYRILIRLAGSRAGKVEGLLGDFDGDPADDIVPAGISAPLAQPVKFEQLYPSYADSWRVAQKDSLFTYAPGQSTDTFTDRSYPEKPMTVADLEPNRRAQAEAICRRAGVTDPWQLLECVFDVGVSGRPEFAVSSAVSEVVSPPRAAPITAPPIVSGTLAPGDRLTFTGRAGQPVFADAYASTMPDRCSPYRLLDPAGKVIGTGCNINGLGHIDRTELVVDGQYTVLVDADVVSTGRATIRVYAAEDTESAIQPNGPLMSATLDRPGSVARYRFAGTAGQRVFVDVPASDLPDQCSPLELRDASGKLLTTGCVINGNGEIEGTLLPADGTYTIVVDPRDRTTGTVHLRLFVAQDQISTIAVNGAPMVADIRQPGFVILYQFQGAAGTSVKLDATDSTLPDQCSPLQLHGPNGKVISSGCVINGRGSIAPTVLPATGTYTVIVDPRGAATGVVTLRLLN
ncbi:VWD domain-containing protein [Allorhizocola rhizosphaerae]|uniref:VWD domain-containing protein n=1 Tax=Allorhizocola rhizosphaerae TaxID=1872709 RepID=UPI000E3C5CE8|nr:VWD domain-containing protein [Allorhizocola rhizosphaerae]